MVALTMCGLLIGDAWPTPSADAMCGYPCTPDAFCFVIALFLSGHVGEKALQIQIKACWDSVGK